MQTITFYNGHYRDIIVIVILLGHPVPEHLDPLTRKRGKQGLIEDGPVTVVNGSFVSLYWIFRNV